MTYIVWCHGDASHGGRGYRPRSVILGRPEVGGSSRSESVKTPEHCRHGCAPTFPSHRPLCKSLLLSRHSRLLRWTDGNIICRTRIRIRPLTLTRLRQLLASDRSLSALAFNRLGTVVVLISLLAIGRLWSQEAVETSTPAKETASEPSPTPEKT